MNKTNFIIIQAFFLLILIGLFLGAYHLQTQGEIVTDTVVFTRTDTFWHDTTIIEKHFVPTTITKIKTDTLYTSNGDTVQLETLSKAFERSVINNEDTADVTIYTTGINTTLDSLKMRLKTHTNTITNTVTITKTEYKNKKGLSIQPQVGVGYGLFKQNLDVFVGVGLTYNF